MTSNLVIPTSTVRAIDEASPDAAVVLLLRHSARGPLPPDGPGDETPLLEEGVSLARTLGERIGSRLRTARSSPVLRCMQTADAVVDGSGSPVHPAPDTALGGPGVYVLDGRVAWEVWRRRGHEAVMEALVRGVALPGLADPRAAARRLVAHMLATADARPGVHVFVTHDSLVTATAAHALGVPLGPLDWPLFLEALVLVADGAMVQAEYRGRRRPLAWG
ncbi:histidine phosphatase family protein [Myxococcota bacterium]|nr:histidine phosphatase family protein [Myxococcota bacterium]